jgi:hypothetical protein
MKLKNIALISTLFLAACGGGSDSKPTKKDSFQLELEEDMSISINLYDYFDQPMKELTFSSDNDKLSTEFNKAKNQIEVIPNVDVNGESKISIEGVDANGTNRLFEYNFNILAINDMPRFTQDHIVLEYNSNKKRYLSTDIFDIETDMSEIVTSISKNNVDMELIIEDNKLYIQPHKLGINKNIEFEITFIDNDQEFKKEFTIEVQYITGQIPLTDASLITVTVLEDNNYIGKIEPKVIYDAQTFEIDYDLSETIGSVVVGDNYSYTYTPQQDYTGSDSFKVEIKNNDGDVVVYTIDIHVVSETDQMYIDDISAVISEDSSYSQAITIIDPENSGSYILSVKSGLTNGSVNFIGNVLEYTPNQDFHGIENFVVEVLDTKLTRTQDFNVSIDVKSSLDPLVINDKTITMLRGHTYTETFTFYDGENSSSDYIFTVSQPIEGSVTINQNGTFTYISHAGGVNAVENFTLYVLDNNNKRTDEATITLNIIDNTSASYNLDILEDVETDQIKIIPIIENQESDYVVTVLSTLAQGVLTINSNNTIKIKSNSHYNGPDSFRLNVRDITTNLTTTLSYTVNFIPVIDQLDLENLNTSLSVFEDGFVEYDMLFLDWDLEGNTAYTIKQGAANGTGSINLDSGLFRYEPSLNFSGEDVVIVTVTKSDTNEAIDIQLNIHVISQEDPLYLTENIEIDMYSGTQYIYNIRDKVVNEDNEEFIFIGDEILEGNTWIINDPDFNIKLDANTGILTILANESIAKDTIKNKYFKIKELDTGTIRIFNIELNIIGQFHFVNSEVALDELILLYTIDNNLYFCPGEYSLPQTGWELPDGMKLYGANTTIDERSEVSFFEGCTVKSGETIIKVSDTGLKLKSDNVIDGIKFVVEGETSSAISSDQIAVNYVLTNNIFEASVHSPTPYIDFGGDGSSATTNPRAFKVTNNKFYGFVNEELPTLDDKYGFETLEVIGDAEFSDNEFENMTKGVKFSNFSNHYTNSPSALFQVKNNSFLNIDNAMTFTRFYANGANTHKVEVHNNIINNAIVGINVQRTNASNNNGGIINVEIQGNIITNVTERGMVFNEDEVGRAGLVNGVYLIKDNTIVVAGGAGILFKDVVVIDPSSSSASSSLTIRDNTITTTVNSIREDHAGIILGLDYYRQSGNTRNIMEDVINLETKTLNVLMHNNTIGDINSTEAFNKASILITKDDHLYNITNSNNYKVELDITNNTLYANQDIVIDHNKINNNPYQLSVNLENNQLLSTYPKPSFTVSENYTNGCVFLYNNNMDFLDLQNHDVNSNMEIADENDLGYNGVFNNQEYLGNAIIENYTYINRTNCH